MYYYNFGLWSNLKNDTKNIYNYVKEKARLQSSSKIDESDAAREAFYNTSMSDSNGLSGESKLSIIERLKLANPQQLFAMVKDLIMQHGWKIALGLLATAGITFGIRALVKALKRKNVADSSIKTVIAQNANNHSYLNIVDDVNNFSYNDDEYYVNMLYKIL